MNIEKAAKNLADTILQSGDHITKKVRQQAFELSEMIRNSDEVIVVYHLNGSETISLNDYYKYMSLLSSHGKIRAIKTLRSDYNLSLRPAKEMIEYMEKN